jgi:hypothetical protein
MLTRPRIGLFVAPGSVRAYDLRLRRALTPAPDLARALAPHQGSRARLEIVLSDAYCRYLVMARPAGIRNGAELEAAAHSRFKAVFGEIDPWQLKLETPARADSDFIAGADRGVLAEIESQAELAGATPISIRPHWVAWARHFHRPIRRGTHWIVCSDGDWMSLGYISQGCYRNARSLRMDGGRADLDSLLARERAFADGIDAAAAIWVCGSGISAQASSPTGSRVTAVNAGALWGVVEGAA